MSTILKALRRLENDDPKKKRAGAPPVLRDAPTAAPLPPSDPRAADALRGRILAEEAAARVVSNLRDEAEPKASRVRLVLVRALAAVAVLAALLFALTRTGLFSDSEPGTASPVATAEPMPPVAPAPVASPSAQPSPAPAPPRAMVAVPNPLEPTDPANAAPPPAPTAVPTAVASIAAPIAATPPSSAVASSPQNAEIARAVPTVQATASAPRPLPPTSTTSAMPPTPVTPPTQPTESARVTPAAQPTPAPTVAAQRPPAPPTRAAAPVPVPTATPEPIQQVAPEVTPRPAPVAAPAARPTPTDVAARRPAEGVPADSTPTPFEREPALEPVPSADVKRVAPAGLPEITVVRTAWHPKPERRSAKVRIVETDELVTVREGDEVEGLVLQEITPSAVIFSAGDVEIRRRVGEASASR